MGPDEIRPTLRAMGDSAHRAVYGPDDYVDVPLEHAAVASQHLFDRSWSPRISVEEGARMRDLADDLGVLVIRHRGAAAELPQA
jgi:hypothetical protein